MRVLVDTNVLLDVIQKRAPFLQPSVAVLEACRDRIIQGCISAQSVADMFYILRKDFTPEERRRILLDICQIMEVESIDKYKLIIALNNDSFNDFEDCLQAECAVTSNAERIVTRNIKHFSNSPVPAISPEDFCKQFLSVEIIDNQ